LVVPASTAQASLQLLDPTSSGSTFIGNGGYSADGLGQNGTGGVVRADVPGGSTVVRAYLYATYFGDLTPNLTDRTINFDGTDVVLTQLPYASPGGSALSTAREEVTSQVAAKVGGGGGITTFTVNNDPAQLDGVALVVLYSNPASSFKTIAVFDGGALQSGDTTSFTFSQPLNPAAPGFGAQMSLGIGFGFQGGAGGHSCDTGSNQSSTVDVNGARLTSCAGNYDDGAGNDGALITVGGVGDSLDNPANPLQFPGDGTTPRGTDDELYNLVPFIASGDTQLKIDTKNVSNNDNVFLAIMAVNGAGCAVASAAACTPPPVAAASTPTTPAASPPATTPAKVPAKATVSVLGVRTACVSSSFSPSVSVRAPAGLKRVTVSVDGRRVQTTKRSKFKLSVNVRKLKPGRHTLTVVTVDSRNRATTTRRSFFRCAQKAAARPQPQFTG
jgi:hypothetical protein